MSKETESTVKEKQIERLAGTFFLLMWLTGRRFWKSLQPFGVTHPQFMILSVLRLHEEPCTMSDLVQASPFQDPPTMTGIVDRLVKLGLVDRRRSATDRRVVLVQINQAGIDLFARVRKTIANDSQGCYGSLSDEELLEVEKLFRHLLRNEMEWCHMIADTDVDLDAVESFMRDPIAFARQESKK
jgi:MarR family 2-MHQ and catechol resistance regulon transcriptional repressor